PEITPLKDERVNAISTGRDILLRCDFLNSGMEPVEGQAITSADVNNQFLTQAAQVTLGDGEPTTMKRVKELSMILKSAGYVILAKDVTIDDHPAFIGRTLTAGTAIPMPMVNYLHEWGVAIPVKEAIVWPKSANRLKPHADALKGYLRAARKW